MADSVSEIQNLTQARLVFILAHDTRFCPNATFDHPFERAHIHSQQCVELAFEKCEKFSIVQSRHI